MQLMQSVMGGKDCLVIVNDASLCWCVWMADVRVAVLTTGGRGTAWPHRLLQHHKATDGLGHCQGWSTVSF